MSTWTPTVNLITDGIDPVSGTTLNPIISSLAARDQYLFDRIDSYDDKSVLMAYGIAADAVSAWDVVYFNADPTVQKLQQAVSGFQNSIDPAHLLPSASAYVFGMIQTVANGTADVYVRGLIPGVPLASIIDPTDTTGHTFGPLYLSFTTPGKLTFSPTGASIFVGCYMGVTDGSTGNLFLAPNIDSLNELYFNYKMYLLASPAGTASLLGDSGIYTIASDITKVGWILATDATGNYGYTAPTNAVYYYNIPLLSIVLANAQHLSDQQIKDTVLLKQAIPPYPAAYTMLFNNGVLQTPNDADHSSGNYIVNDDGVWWCDPRLNYTPWPTGDVTAVNLLLQTTKLNPFYKESVVSSMAPFVSTGSNDTSQAITFVDKASGIPSTTGDLLLKLNLPVITTSTITGTPTAVQSVSFAPALGAVEVVTGPSVSGVAAGPGLTASKNTSTGLVTVSLSNYTLSGDVEDLEPVESDFVYKGLHSYLRMKNPSTNQQVGLIGKVQLPQLLPIGLSFKVKLLAFGDAALTNQSVVFNFSYAISGVDPAGSPIGSTTFNGTYNGSSAISLSGFVQNTTRMVDYDSSSPKLPYFEIPAAAFAAYSYPSYANFKLVRTNSGYTGNINVLAVVWAIE